MGGWVKAMDGHTVRVDRYMERWGKVGQMDR